MIADRDAEVDRAGIEYLYKSSDTARRAFDYFAQRQRNANVTPVDRLSRVIGVSYAEAKTFLKELERLQCGRYTTGRRGKQSRMEWRVDVVSLGKAAAGNRVEIQSAPGGDEDTDEQEHSATTNHLTVGYPLRPDLTIQLILPKDLTTREAQRLADFIRTLPFKETDASPTESRPGSTAVGNEV